MDIQINFNPDTLHVDDFIIKDMFRAANLVADIYDVDDCEVDITISDDNFIHELNRHYRHVDSPTDVLSFAFRESAIKDAQGVPIILGQIVISLDRAAAQAYKFNHSVHRELVFLELHGLLHLLGFDHVYDDERIIMEQLQRDLLQRLGL